MLFRRLPDFLGPDVASELLEFSVEREADFVPSMIGAEGTVLAKARRSRFMRNLGRFGEVLEGRIRPLVPELVDSLRISRFVCDGFEIELVAHEDGAFYTRHIDLYTGADARGTDRVISLVYYLHAQPKAFSGGSLKLYPQFDPRAGPDEGAVEIEPEHDTAIAFSTWLPHEVLPVSCPSRLFRNARFAVNCWILRQSG